MTTPAAAADPIRALQVCLGAGDPFCLEPAELELTLAPQDRSACDRLLLEALEGDPALAIRGDEAEECWRIVEPIVAEWGKGTPPLLSYPAGSTGPPLS